MLPIPSHHRVRLVSEKSYAALRPFPVERAQGTAALAAPLLYDAGISPESGPQILLQA